ncbi:MAG: hypothetical protein BMS9Abin13_093 [Patescibacteria group bacterium]|nr:MAG: hypothetical protein BMS9Abin13_093 [Patescibacteria group bacterium]
MEKIEKDFDPTIAMQVELMRKHPDCWIEKHAAEFRDLVESHPEIVQTFKNDPTRAIEELEGKFYHG